MTESYQAAYFLKIDDSELTPGDIHSADRDFQNHDSQYTFPRNKLKMHTIYSLYDVGMVPNHFSHTFPYPCVYSYDFAADSR